MKECKNSVLTGPIMYIVAENVTEIYLSRKIPLFFSNMVVVLAQCRTAEIKNSLIL